MSARIAAAVLLVAVVLSGGPAMAAPAAAGPGTTTVNAAAGPGVTTVDAGTAGGPSADAGTAGVGTDAVSDAARSGTAARAGTGASTIERTFTVSLTPTDPGAVRVRAAFVIPEGVTSLTARVPENATVVGTDGFRRSGGREYEWTRSTRRPSLTYRLSVNRTVSRGIEGATSGGYLYVDAGEWAIVPAPGMAMRYSGIGEEPEVVDSVEIDGKGATGGDIVYLGAYSEHVREAAGQRFRLVVPADAEMAESPDAVLDAVATLAGRELGPRDRTVFMVAAPTTVEWGSAGLQRGAADLWVRDRQRLSSPNNVWFHEYVHTRQAYEPSSETRWTIEGMADYYAALATLEQGRVGYDRFRDQLGLGTRYGDAVLADPGSWTGTAADYRKGALALGAIDRRIRLATGGERTLADAIARVNGDGTVSGTEFLDAVGTVGGPDVRAYAREHVETSATPALWNESEHAAAFGLPVVGYAFASFRVTGPYRNATFDEPPVLVPGERLAVRVRAENAGTEAGDYRATLRAGGRTVGTRTGTLAPGERVELDFEVPVEAVGAFALAVGDAGREVAVRRPAAPRVTALDAPASVPPGEPFEVRASVANPADRPADGKVTIRADGEAIATRTVRLAPNGTATVAATVRFDEAGEHAVDAGDRRATVRVGTPTTAGSPAPSTPGEGVTSTAAGPGFGGPLAVAGLAALAAFALGRQHRRDGS